MASQVCETLAFINGDDEVKGMDVMEINGDILMSLMEESSPSDESDDDRLNSLIRSFEAEISGSKNDMEGHDSSSSLISSELGSNVGEDAQSWNMGHVDGQDYLGSSSNEFEVEWVDMDDFMPSSSCDEKSWCIDTFGVENIDGMSTCYDGFAMEEHGYNSFWQDSCYNLVR